MWSLITNMTDVFVGLNWISFPHSRSCMTTETEDYAKANSCFVLQDMKHKIKLMKEVAGDGKIYSPVEPVYTSDTCLFKRSTAAGCLCLSGVGKWLWDVSFVKWFQTLWLISVAVLLPLHALRRVWTDSQVTVVLTAVVHTSCLPFLIFYWLAGYHSDSLLSACPT